MPVVLPEGKQSFTTNAGLPLVGGKLYTYQPGTSTPKATYTDFAGGTPNTNPVVANARGEMAVYWDGVYDVTLRDASDNLIWGPERVETPEASGAAAAVIARLASTTVAADGAGMVGHNATLNYPEGTLGRKARDWISPTDYPWLADNTGANDATAAINACYQFCKSSGRGMRPRNGTYKCQTQTTTFELPRDDGSFSPGIGGGETTIAAEAATTMPVCLVFDGNVEVVGESAEGVIFLGDWTYSSSAINTSQKIGVLQGANKDSYTQFKLKNIQLKNFMLPLVVQGAATQSEIDIVIDGAGIASCVQAADGNTKWSGRLIRCYAGHILGGWWLQRNRAISATHMPSGFGAGYPASDIFRSCWGENIEMGRVEWTAQPAFDARADSIDSFFNTYFFKTANSAIYPAGRATVNADAGFTAGAGYPTYRGVFGTVWAVISRNGRYGSRMRMSEVVSSGSSRAAWYVNAGSQLAQRQAYFENSALVNPGGGLAANTMGVDRADPYRAGAPISLGLWLENEGGAGTYLEEISGQDNAPGVPSIDPARRYNVQIGNRSSAMFELLGGVRFADADTPLTAWKETAFPVAPVISIGGTDQAGWANDYASYKRLNTGIVWFRFSMSKAVPAYAGSGSVTIKNLPFAALGGGCVNVSYYSSYTPAGEVHAFISGTTIQLSKGANRGTDVTHADLGAGAGVLTVEGWYFA